MDIELMKAVVAMMILTFVVWMVMFAFRLTWMKQARVHPQSMKRACDLDPPERASWSSDHLKNMFEMPILFYAICILVVYAEHTDRLYVTAAWTYVGFRAAQALIHISINHVLIRFTTYIISSLCLWLMIFRFARQLLLK